MIYWMNVIIGGILYTFFTAMVWSLLLKPRWPHIPRWLLCAGFVAVNFVPGIVRSFCGEFSSLFHAMGFLQMAIMFLFLFGCFNSPWWKKLLALFLYLICAHLAEGIVFPLFELIGVRYTPDFNSYELFILQSAVCMVSMCLSAVLVFLWHQIEIQRKIPKTAWVYLSLPISQVLMVWNVAKAFWVDDTAMLPTALGCIIGFLADIMLFYFLMEQGEKEELAIRLRELEKLRSVEEMHYKTILQRREKLAKIRHDFNNQLATVLHLTETGDSQRAKEMLERLRENIMQTQEAAYCNNTIVNAVLAEKASECHRLEIPLDVDILLEEEVAVAPLHLCSIFSNLLDNAMRAAQACRPEQRQISVRGSVRGDYLHIKVVNSMEWASSAQKKNRKGYGQEIIKEIASQYNGEFQTEQRDGRYTAMLSLEIASKK